MNPTRPSIALCFIKTASALPGTEIDIAILGQPHRAVILDRPPFDPAGERVAAASAVLPIGGSAGALDGGEVIGEPDPEQSRRIRTCGAGAYRSPRPASVRPPSP